MSWPSVVLLRLAIGVANGAAGANGAARAATAGASARRCERLDRRGGRLHARAAVLRGAGDLLQLRRVGLLLLLVRLLGAKGGDLGAAVHHPGGAAQRLGDDAQALLQVDRLRRRGVILSHQGAGVDQLQRRLGVAAQLGELQRPGVLPLDVGAGHAPPGQAR